MEVVGSCWHWVWCGGNALVDKHTFPVHQEMLFTLCMSPPYYARQPA